jgi:hypothetical protein
MLHPAVNLLKLLMCAGGENGFNQAIELSSDMLSNVKFVQEKRLISKFFDEISQDTGKFVFSVKDTLACLEMGAVETLIVWEALDCDRWVLCIAVKCSAGAAVLGVRRRAMALFLWVLLIDEVCVQCEGHAGLPGDGSSGDAHHVGGTRLRQVG